MYCQSLVSMNKLSFNVLVQVPLPRMFPDGETKVATPEYDIGIFSDNCFAKLHRLME